MLHVLLMQLPVPNNPATNLPLAAGYLKAYAHAQGLLDAVSIDILPRALADYAGDALLVEAICARGPALLGISLYTWNSERSLNIARHVKQRLPGLLVVVGGPEVQRDNQWVLEHPAVDIAVLGEGEQTFVELLRLFVRGQGSGARGQALQPHPHSPMPDPRSLIAGLAFRDATNTLIFTHERVPLADLRVVPSPYLLGYLEAEAGTLLLVEISRWCPYSCSFCLYGRSMGPRLGGRLFPLEQILAEIAWGYARGIRTVHFVEANLNLVPPFQPLMQALARYQGELALYAELRGEHLSDAVVQALVRAGLHVAEVGLQTANPAALRAVQRRTDLAKWAAGTRRLYEYGVSVLLDVILGLPEDDAAGVAETLAFIQREGLGPYDVFTLQLLPGTVVRQQASEFGYQFQDRPPYYVLANRWLSYAQLRELRHMLKHGAGLDPDEIEGCPEPRLGALVTNDTVLPAVTRLGQHVDLVANWPIDGASWATWLAEAIAANPSALFDLYLHCAAAPEPAALRTWHARLPFTPGYLDRLAVYRHSNLDAQSTVPANLQSAIDNLQSYHRVSPRIWLVLPWVAQADPASYRGVAEIIWRYPLAVGETPPLAAWAAAGGAGVWVPGAHAAQAGAWQAASGVRIWWGIIDTTRKLAD